MLCTVRSSRILRDFDNYYVAGVPTNSRSTRSTCSMYEYCCARPRRTNNDLLYYIVTTVQLRVTLVVRVGPTTLLHSCVLLCCCTQYSCGCAVVQYRTAVKVHIQLYSYNTVQLQLYNTQHFNTLGSYSCTVQYSTVLDLVQLYRQLYSYSCRGQLPYVLIADIVVTSWSS